MVSKVLKINRVQVGLWLASALLLQACSSHRILPESGIHDSVELADVVLASEQYSDRYAAKDVLVIFDIDDTLLSASQMLGSNAWYDWQSELAEDSPCSSNRVGDRLAVQGALFAVGGMQLTQADAAQIVSTLQTSNVRVMALTARGKEFRLPTFREMRRNGLDFRETAPGPKRGYALDFMPETAKRAVRYEDGVLFVAGQDKGQMLADLLNRTDYSPRVVVAVDDSLGNLEAMQTALESMAIDYSLFHFRRIKNNAAPLDEHMLTDQWRKLAPALRQIQEIMGTVNYQLPSTDMAPECESN